MIIQAKWSNFHEEYKRTQESYSEWVKVVDVSVPAHDIVITFGLPKSVTKAQLTEYLQNSKKLIAQLKAEYDKQQEHDFEITI